MNEQLHKAEARVNNLTVRERSLILVTILALSGFAWWHFFAQPLMQKTKNLEKQNTQLSAEITVAQTTANAINQRLRQGVHNEKKDKIKTLTEELKRVNEALNQKTLELIGPNEMFELMLQLITADSKLKLTGLKRQQLKPVFTVDKDQGQQPQIFRHVMRIEFEGKYQNILAYISRLEKLDWKLLWDRISLKTDAYPLVKVSIEISTLSDSKHWVGL